MLHFLNTLGFACLVSYILKILKSYPTKFCKCGCKSGKNVVIFSWIERIKIRCLIEMKVLGQWQQEYIDVNDKTTAGRASFRTC